MKCGDPDNDKDGYKEVDGDCDDTSKAIFPGAKEKCGDFVDQNCDGYEKVCVEAQPLDIFERVFPEIEKPGGSWSPTRTLGSMGDWSQTSAGNSGFLATAPFASAFADNGILREAEQWVASLISMLITATPVILRSPTEQAGAPDRQKQESSVILRSPIEQTGAPDRQKQESSVILSAPVVATTGSEGSQQENTTIIDTTDRYAPAKQNSSKAGFSTTTVALYYTFGDHLGSSSVTLDASGNLVQATDYFPYGGTNVDEKYGSFANPYTYTGKELDSEVDLYYYGARYYNAGFSRFTSVDPALFDPRHLLSILADPQSLNSYAYARNNPIRLLDPDGRFWQELKNWFKYGVYAKDDRIAELERHALEREQNSSESYFLSDEEAAYMKSRSLDESFAKYNVCLLCENEETIDSNNINIAELSDEQLIANRQAILRNAEAAMSLIFGVTGNLASPLDKAGKLTQDALKNSHVIAGEGADELKQAGRLVKQYGGEIKDWFKKTTDAFIDANGYKYQIHYYQNEATGLLKEGKMKYSDQAKDSVRLDW